MGTLIYIAGAVGGALVIGAFIFVALARRKRKIGDLFSLRLLSVQLSKKPEGAEKNIDTELQEIGHSSQLLNLLANLKMPFAFEAAVPNIGQDISFYIAVPEKAVAFATNQIHGLWPESEVKPADEYTVFHPDGAAVGAYLKQRASYLLPIRTYLDARIDTFAPIVSNLSNLELVGEGMALQVIAQPAHSAAKTHIAKAIHDLRKGKKLTDVLSKDYGGVAEGISEFTKLVESKKHEKPEKELEYKRIVDDDAIKVLSKKIEQPLFDVNIRLVAAATSDFQAGELLDRLTSSFRQFSAPLRNEIRIIKPRNIKSFIYRFAMREFDPSQTMIMNTEEIASIFHFPSSLTNVPKIKWLKTREAAPPTSLPNDGLLMGESVFRGESKPVFLSDDDRRRHIYLIGQTGTGKSTLISNMAIDDIQKGKGVAIIDPHGDLIESVLGLIPKSRYEDVIIFDPGDRERPLGMNMLEYDIRKPEEKTFIVNELFNILDKLYDMKTVGGPMFEQYTKNATMLLMEDMHNEPATLMEIPRVFTDPEYRNKKLARITNPVIIDFWNKEAIKATGEHSLANMAPYITSKFNNFISNDYVRPIIGQPKSAFNFRNVMDEGKILLVNLSKGKIGEVNANLLGMVIVGKILMAALSRVDIQNQDARRDFNLFIDEFQNFSTESIATILSEARKYRLNLTMAHQFIGQLTEKIRDAVFGSFLKSNLRQYFQKMILLISIIETRTSNFSLAGRLRCRLICGRCRQKKGMQHFPIHYEISLGSNTAKTGFKLRPISFHGYEASTVVSFFLCAYNSHAGMGKRKDLPESRIGE